MKRRLRVELLRGDGALVVGTVVATHGEYVTVVEDRWGGVPGSIDGGDKQYYVRLDRCRRLDS